MNELIKVSQSNIGAETVNTVNARELHEFLEVKTKFADWIKERIGKYDFVENRDFTVLKNRNGEKGKFTPIEYHVSIDMAKELAMVENNEQGKKARQYFIEVDKQYRAASDTTNALIAALTPVIRENEQLKAKYDFARNFLPRGRAGELAKSGLPKNQYRRGFYCSKNGRDTSLLLEHPSLPGFYEEYKQIGGAK